MVAVVMMGLCSQRAVAQPYEPPYCIFPEQKQIQYRCPEDLCRLPIPGIPRPPTVKDPQDTRTAVYLSLDEAIRIALANAEVIRVLNGFSASSTGNTIYDPAIQNTTIDNARARFDPRLSVKNTWSRDESTFVLPDPIAGAVISGSNLESYNLGLGLSETNVTGGTATLGVNAFPNRAGPVGGLLNPQTPSSVDLGFTQPLLQGGGIGANMAPVVIARINSERSYFQFKDSVQEMVRSIIDGYWGLVFARTDVWAREQQVKQAEFALNSLEAQKAVGRANLGDTAQAAVSLANFRASLITSRANLLDREAAFRNALGLPPVDDRHFIASTPPTRVAADPQWESLLLTAETYRPDLIELKLVLEADQQQNLIANNQALPRLDASALYRWDGLEGTTPLGTVIRSAGGQFTDWQIGCELFGSVVSAIRTRVPPAKSADYCPRQSQFATADACGLACLGSERAEP